MIFVYSILALLVGYATELFLRKVRWTAIAVLSVLSLAVIGMTLLALSIQTKVLYCCEEDIAVMEPFDAFIHGVDVAVASGHSILMPVWYLVFLLLGFSVSSKLHPKPSSNK